jgi:translation initiation factor 1
MVARGAFRRPAAIAWTGIPLRRKILPVSKRDRIPPKPAAPFNNPFAGISARLGVAPPPSEPPATKPAPGTVSRAVVRLERKGRGGKEATVIEKLDLAPHELERWLVDLKKALGCGGAVEGEALVLQGDLRARLRPLLEKRGVRKITLG